MKTLKSFENHLLIAVPSMTEGFFQRSVTYICEHNNEGAMGIVINLPSLMTFRELISQADDKAIIVNDKAEQIVLCGGPVHQDRGFILHKTQAGWASSVAVNSDIMITTSKDILSALGNKNGPEESLIALGCAGWEAGQLENELKENTWLMIEADQDLLFKTPMHSKWQEAMNKLGIDAWQLTQDVGHA